MENKEAIKYLIPPVATSTKPSAEYLKQKEAYELAIKALEKPQVTVFAENASKEEIEDFKQELENVLEKTQNFIYYNDSNFICERCGRFTKVGHLQKEVKNEKT